MQLGQHQRVAAVRLDPVARLHRDQRGGHHDTRMPAPGQQSMKPVAARARLVAEVQLSTAPGKPRRHFDQDVRAVLEDADLPDLAASSAFRYRDVNRRFVHVQSDKNDIVHQARPLA